jgi:hypothetical protein
MRSRPIQIETCRTLPLLSHFHASTVSHFDFFDRLARLVGMIRRLAPLDAFQVDAMRFEKVKQNRSNGGGSFKASVYVSVKVPLMIM